MSSVSFEIDVIEGINNVVGMDRSKLRHHDSQDLISKFQTKLDSLKERFIINLPYQYNDNTEFSNMIKKLKGLKEKSDELKTVEYNLRSLINNYKIESDKNDCYENEIKPLVLKAMAIERMLCYSKCLMKLEDFRSNIEMNVSKLKELEDKQNHLMTSISTNENSKKSNQHEVTAQNLNKCNAEIDELIERLVVSYIEFIDYCLSLKDTNCLNLKGHINILVTNLSAKLISILKKEFKKYLELLSYPFLSQALQQNIKSSNQNVKSGENSQNNGTQDAHVSQVKQTKQNNELKFQDIAAKLLRIDYKTRKYLSNSDGSISNLVIELLVEPLEKRFKFHFFGNRKTNNLDKPEWFLIQILQWIKDHDRFIIDNVQQIFDKNMDFIDSVNNRIAIVEYSNALIRLISEKLSYDLSNLIKNQNQFSHLIDELISFDNQLKSYLKTAVTLDYISNNSLYSCLHILCENSLLFSQWLYLERQVCQKKVDLMFSGLNVSTCNDLLTDPLNDKSLTDATTSKSNKLDLFEDSNEIWTCNYSDVDSMKPPNCAESFVLMIKAITDRCSNLPYPSKKLRFLYLQIELLNDFHLRLCQIIRDESKTPFNKNYLGVLNTVNYIIFILDEWKNSAFYIDMQLLKIKYQQFQKKCDNLSNQSSVDDEQEINNQEVDLESSDDFLNEAQTKLFDTQIMNSELNSLSYSFNSLFDMDETVFDEVLTSYKKIKEDMIDTITVNCKWEITSRSKFYKKEKWMSMPLFTEFYKPTLTQSAADMLISLRNMLHLLKESVAKSLFETILKKLTYEMDKFFYEDIISVSNFNEGGISQLDYDVTKYLLPILNEFAFDIKIENYFKTTKESIILLKLKQGSAILLKDILNKAMSEDESLFETETKNLENNNNLNIFNAKNALKEFGIVQLSCKQAKDVLSLRSDFIQ